jgi:hypothetical protein
MRVIRILKYEGSEDWIKDTLKASLPDGTKQVNLGLDITAITLGDMPDNFDIILQTIGKKKKADASPVLNDNDSDEEFDSDGMAPVYGIRNAVILSIIVTIICIVAVWALFKICT